MIEDISSCSSSIDLIAGSAHLYLMLPAIFVILIMADIEIYQIFLIFSSSLKPLGLEFQPTWHKTSLDKGDSKVVM